MTELIVTIMIVGALAAIAVPRLANRSAFESRGFSDEAIGVVRFAQKTAIAWRRAITVCVSASAVSAISSGTCAAPVALTHPVTGGPLQATAPSGVTLSILPAGEFSFDALGRTAAQKTITLTSTIAGDPTRQIVVAAETGYVSTN